MPHDFSQYGKLPTLEDDAVKLFDAYVVCGFDTSDGCCDYQWAWHRAKLLRDGNIGIDKYIADLKQTCASTPENTHAG